MPIDELPEIAVGEENFEALSRKTEIRDAQNPFERRATRSPSIAARIFECTSTNFAGSIVSGVPLPAYFVNVEPAFRRFALTFEGSP
jgi:hypothetical protein